MSDRPDTSDTSVRSLLDRADELAPPMVVEPDAVIGAGRRTRRRRRTSAATGLGAMALVGALWLGGPLSPSGSGGPTPAPAPAAIGWEQGLEEQLFDNSPHPVHEPERTHWVAELRSGEGDAAPELVLTRDGEQLDPVDAQDGPGEVMLFQAEGISVAVWQSPEGSLGEQPQWAPGVLAGQGGELRMDDVLLRYAVAEIVPGATGDLVDLYWFTEDAAHAASGATVASAVLAAGDTRALVLLDEARQVWGVAQLDQASSLLHVERLVAGSGSTGWTGEEVVATAVGVLPPDASAPTVDAETTTLVQAALGSRTAVLAVDATGWTGAGSGATVSGSAGTDTVLSPPPTVRFTLDGEEHQLMSYAQDYGRTLDVGDGQLLVNAQPDGLDLRRGASSHLIPAEDLTDGRALVGPAMDGQVIVVPGWDPDADPEELRVLVGTDDEQRFVDPKGAHVDALFDGRPLVVLALGRGALADDESVLGVGVVEGGEVVEHELEDGVVELDLGL